MAKKQKEKPVLTLDDKEYIIEDMTDKQKELANEVILNQNHVNDIKNKLANNAFMRQQLIECEIAFVEKYQSHINDIQNKLNTNAFMRQQLVECEKSFVDKHQKGIKELREVLKEK